MDGAVFPPLAEFRAFIDSSDADCPVISLKITIDSSSE